MPPPVPVPAVPPVPGEPPVAWLAVIVTDCKLSVAVALMNRPPPDAGPPLTAPAPPRAWLPAMVLPTTVRTPNVSTSMPPAWPESPGRSWPGRRRWRRALGEVVADRAGLQRQHGAERVVDAGSAADAADRAGAALAADRLVLRDRRV